MRSLLIIPAAIVALVACNSGTQESNAADTSHAAMGHDSMQHAMPAADAAMAMEAIPAGAKVFFVNLKDGQTVPATVKVEMGAEGIAVDSAGTLRPASGHHHLLIDAGDSIPAGTVVIKDSAHLHFGNAQKETTITLTPGKHRLTLQFADGIHRSYGSALTSSITVEVKK